MFWQEFLEAAMPRSEVSDDVLRFSARALKYSADTGVPPTKDTGIPMAYATRNKPTDGAVTGS